MFRTLNQIVMALVLVPQLALAADLYVSASGSDSNPGTQTAPLKSIKKASTLAKPGTVVHVAPGVYPGSFITSASGTASARIRYISDRKWGAKIVPPSNSTTSGGWKNEGDYVDIIGFEIDGSVTQGGTKWRNALVAVGSYNLIQQNHIHHIGLEGSDCLSKGGSGINSHNYNEGYHNDIISNVVHHVGPPLCKYFAGIYFSTSGKVKNNLIYEVGNWGIQTWHDAGHIDIANNTIVKSGGGIMVGGGGYYHLPGPADYINVSNNLVYDNAKGIMNQGEVGTHNIYTNNLSYKNLKYTMTLSAGNTATGTIQAEPQFVDYAGGNFRLKATSPGVDQGLATYAPKGDIDGILRPKGGAVDIGAYEYAAPATCTFNGNAVANGASVTAYQAASVPFNQSCVSQTRTCSNGILSGTYAFASCSVQAPPAPTIVSTPAVSNLTTNSVTIKWSLSEPSTGQIQFGVTTNYGSLSTLESRLMSGHTQVLSGLLDGTTYHYRIISKNAAGAVVMSPDATFTTVKKVALNCEFNGKTILSGSSVTAYQALSGSSCSSQTRTCSNGVLSGTYLYSSCTVVAPAPAPQPAPAPAPSPASGPAPAPAPSLYSLFVAPTGSDSNSGSSASAPLKSLSKAASLVKAGTTVYVAPGNYSGFTISASGTASNRIRFVSTTKWGAKVLGSSISLAGSYLDLEGFELNGQNASGLKNGITTKGSYIRIISNHVHNIATDISVCTEMGGSGINAGGYYNGVKIDVIGNVVHHIGSKGCKYIQGIYPSTSGTIKNNLIHNIGNWGIHLWHDAGYLDIANNTIINSGGGITVGGGGFWHKSITDYVNVSNNIVANNDKGILEQGVNGTHNTYTNNLTFNNLKYNTIAVGAGVLKSANIVADPQFVSPSTNNFKLKINSPAINKGSSKYAPPTDIEGRARPQGGVVDIGAYEY